MDQFIHKTISDTIRLKRAKAGPVECVVTRTRTSKAYAAIQLSIDNSTVLCITREAYGDDYEQAVRDIAELLIRAADEPCALPAG